MALTPVAPSLSAIGTNGFTIAVNPDGNPVGTYYTFKVVFGTTVKYLNALGALVDPKTYINTTSITAALPTPNTLYSVTLTASDDAVGTNESGEGPSASATTLAALPLASAFQSVYSTTVTAAWTANNNPSGTAYFVQLSTDPSFVFNVVNSGWITDLSYAFTNLLPSTTYYGRVKARNTVLVETAYTSLNSTITPAGPDTVKVIHVTNLLAERGFLITWSTNLEPNVVNYKVYRGSSPTDNGEFKLIATTPANVTSYVDRVPFTFGITWYYKVTALDNGNNESSLELTTPVQDMTYHSFEEQPFPTTVSANDFVNDETPTGVVNGVNTLFTTAFPYKKNTVEVYLNGVRMHKTLDFTEGPLAQQITFLDPPDLGGILRVQYLKF